MEEKKLTMKDYVIETPAAVLANIDRSEALTASLLDEFLEGNYHRILLVACGSSYNGCLCARAFLHHILGIRVDLVSPFTFVNYEDEFDEHDLILVVSQSGRSTNSLEALNHIRKYGHRTVGLTGNTESPMKDACDLVTDWGAGIEKVGMVTKGVVTLALYLMLFGLEAAIKTGRISLEQYEYWKDEMRKCMKAHEQLQASTFAFIDTHRKDLLSMHNVWTVSAGTNLATAVEAALKIGESVKVHAAAYEAEEFLHGPVYPMNPDYTVIFYDSNDNKTSARIHQIYQAAKAVTDRAYIVTDQRTDDPDAIRTGVHVQELLNPLAYLAVAPLLAEYVQETKNTDYHPLNKRFREIITVKAK
ncbi:MAG: SIS domain-containing protein [Erysipelotrichaceae bacterium]|nr:SIS domain-containing protein [Erysipelotrichaceae bacterium]